MSRDVRSNYYRSLGAGVSEARTLENLLQEKVIDLERLRAACIRFGIPKTLRPVVWDVFAGVLPLERDNWAFMRTHLGQMCGEIQRAAAALYGYGEERSALHQEERAHEIFEAFWVLWSLWKDPTVLDTSLRGSMDAAVMSLCRTFCGTMQGTESGESVLWSLWSFWRLLDCGDSSDMMHRALRGRWAEISVILVANGCGDIVRAVAVHWNSGVEKVIAQWLWSAFSICCPMHMALRVIDAVLLYSPKFLVHYAAALLLHLRGVIMERPESAPHVLDGLTIVGRACMLRASRPRSALMVVCVRPPISYTTGAARSPVRGGILYGQRDPHIVQRGIVFATRRAHDRPERCAPGRRRRDIRRIASPAS